MLWRFNHFLEWFWRNIICGIVSTLKLAAKATQESKISEQHNFSKYVSDFHSESFKISTTKVQVTKPREVFFKCWKFKQKFFWRLVSRFHTCIRLIMWWSLRCWHENDCFIAKILTIYLGSLASLSIANCIWFVFFSILNSSHIWHDIFEFLDSL